MGVRLAKKCPVCKGTGQITQTKSGTVEYIFKGAR